jgi:hypothetical protein
VLRSHPAAARDVAAALHALESRAAEEIRAKAAASGKRPRLIEHDGDTAVIEVSGATNGAGGSA